MIILDSLILVCRHPCPGVLCKDEDRTSDESMQCTEDPESKGRTSPTSERSSREGVGRRRRVPPARRNKGVSRRHRPRRDPRRDKTKTTTWTMSALGPSRRASCRLRRRKRVKDRRSHTCLFHPSPVDRPRRLYRRVLGGWSSSFRSGVLERRTGRDSN